MSDVTIAARRATTRRPTLAGGVRELAVMLGLFVAYRQVRHLTSGDLEGALANADRVVAFERALGAFHELAVQRLVLRSQLAIDALNHYYVLVHFPATIAVLVWLFTRHHGAYARVRAWFLAVTVAGLAIHVAVPLAPPRMLRDHGFVDTLAVYGPRIYSDDVTASTANQLAAMPSLHFAWAALVAGAALLVCRSRWRWLALAHPAVTLLAIVATANHYWLDAAVGGLLVSVAVVATGRVLDRSTTTAPAPVQVSAPDRHHPAWGRTLGGPWPTTRTTTSTPTARSESDGARCAAARGRSGCSWR